MTPKKITLKTNKKLAAVLIGLSIGIIVSLLGCLLVLLWPEVDYKEIPNLNRYYTYDGNIYFKSNHSYDKVSKADVASFERMSSSQANNRMIYQYAAKDKNHIYSRNKIIEDIDYQTAEYLGNEYFRDKSHVFYQTKILENADPKQFVLLFKYAHDNKGLYYEGKLIPGADVATISETKQGYNVRDKNHVYYKDQIIEKANPDTYELIRPHYAGWDSPTVREYGYDGKYYFYKNKIVKANDGTLPDKIHVLLADRSFSNHELFWSDENIYYFDTDDLILKKFSERDNNSLFKVIGNGLFADSLHVYYTAKHRYIRGRRGNFYSDGTSTSFNKLEKIEPISFIKQENAEFTRKDLPTKSAGPNSGSSENVKGTLYRSVDRSFFHPEDSQEFSLYGLNNNKLYLLPEYDLAYNSFWTKICIEYRFNLVTIIICALFIIRSIINYKKKDQAT